MKDVECKEVVITTIGRRGRGIVCSPIRAITQVWEKNGDLIAEYDPSPDIDSTKLILFALWCKEKKLTTINERAVEKWVSETHQTRDA